MAKAKSERNTRGAPAHPDAELLRLAAKYFELQGQYKTSRPDEMSAAYDRALHQRIGWHHVRNDIESSLRQRLAEGVKEAKKHTHGWNAVQVEPLRRLGRLVSAECRKQHAHWARETQKLSRPHMPRARVANILGNGAERVRKRVEEITPKTLEGAAAKLRVEINENRDLSEGVALMREVLAVIERTTRWPPGGAPTPRLSSLELRQVRRELRNRPLSNGEAIVSTTGERLQGHPVS